MIINITSKNDSSFCSTKCHLNECNDPYFMGDFNSFYISKKQK